eukprot:1405380-Prymnesium_polylepis.1
MHARATEPARIGARMLDRTIVDGRNVLPAGRCLRTDFIASVGFSLDVVPQTTLNLKLQKRPKSKTCYRIPYEVPYELYARATGETRDRVPCGPQPYIQL